MPIYEYVCDKCGEHLELLQKIGDPAPKRCAKCKKGKMEKMISRTSFQLKGSGWYASDYASKPAAGKAEKKSESKTESKPESKKESKAESKSDDATSGTKPAPAA